MKIIIACSKNTIDKKKQSIDCINRSFKELNYNVEFLEINENPHNTAILIEKYEPDIIWNMGVRTDYNDYTFFPALLESMKIAYTGNNTSFLSLHNRLNISRAVIANYGIKTVEGSFYNSIELKNIICDFEKFNIRDNIHFDNSNIYKNLTKATLQEKIQKITSQNLEGVIVEKSYNKELIAVFLEGYNSKIIEVFEKDNNGNLNIIKDNEEIKKNIRLACRNIIKKNSIRDYGIIHFFVDNNNQIYFSNFDMFCDLSENSCFRKAIQSVKLSFTDFVKIVIKNTVKRSGISKNRSKVVSSRETARNKGITIGRYETGKFNSITDIRGIRVGHFTRIEDNVEILGSNEASAIRTGVTSIIPAKDIYQRRMIAGGFVLNGVGEMAGLTQVKEWGLLETPILLTNSMSVGKVHDGIINYMRKIYPDLGVRSDVVLPVVGETDDSFLNDVRVGINKASDAVYAIENAKAGRIQQGSVGAGTGMVTCDFAGGIGTSSRIVPLKEGGFTIGVLVLSNFGKMRNLTIDGSVVGRILDKEISEDIRRKVNYGSIIIVVATDAPLNSSQLNRIAKRAALGLGRTGSYAGYTSGEIIIAFSTANRIPRVSDGKFLTIKFLSDEHIDPIYEATVEATEEAIINAIFCSPGMNGRDNRQALAIDHDKVLKILGLKTLGVGP